MLPNIKEQESIKNEQKKIYSIHQKDLTLIRILPLSSCVT